LARLPARKKRGGALQQTKKELIIAVGKIDTHCFDPKKGWGTHGQTHLTHSSLLTLDSDIAVIGDLAASWTVSEDGLIWTFVLRDNIKFSNGDSLTAEDVKFTYDMLKEDGIAYNLTFLERVEAQETNNAVFFLKQPTSTFTTQLLQIGIVPKSVYNDNYSSNPVASGPYKVVQYDEGQQVILESNPYWYGVKPHFQKLTFLFLLEDAALAAARAGTVDLIYIPLTFGDQQVAGMKLHEFDSVSVRGITMPTIKSGGTGLMVGKEVKTGNDATSDPAVRKALTYGLDRQKIVDVAMQGRGHKAYSLCDGMPWFNEKTVIQDGNIEKAKKILADAGWADANNDGIVEKNGVKAEFDLYHSAADKLRGNIALVAADMALDMGIKINVRGVTWDEIYTNSKTSAVLWATGNVTPYPLYSHYSNRMLNVGYYNMMMYDNPVVSGYLDQAMQSVTLDEAYRYWKLAQWDGSTGVSALGDEPIIWLVRLSNLYLAKEQLNLGKQPILHNSSYEWALLSNIETWTWNE
jgi:peptide/nickel transport system substrate-binding protein